ncbi:SusC/RagA family TonB-linked outer membrane protein [Fulvitalea axinellae]|uniref:SusC/RagA family TonB-linked outer membrane protein n=1 Tax=Fulvitalea axinellae TaxID=1182444 RepID=A0AAU9D4N3_9BACT|nr:SusC/RagA family TonB-linked outer membrane protein [Fulvitalea axinellae]
MKYFFSNILLLGCLLTSALAYAQGTVTGKVMDAEGGAVIPGVVVNLVGSDGVSAFTAEDGTYSIEVTSESEVALEFAYAGYNSKTVYLNGRMTVDIVLVPKGGLDEKPDVQTAYGTFRANELSGSSVTLTRHQIMDRGYVTLESALQGMVPGLFVQSRSGTTASGASMRLRGVSTMSAKTQPLIVVDGVIYETEIGSQSSIEGFTFNPLSNIQIRDIEQVTVSKDGMAANYGVLGANGVILIQTRESESTETRVDFSANLGVVTAPERTPVLDAASFKNYTLEQLVNSGMSHSSVEYIYPFLLDMAEGEEKYRYDHDTDWQDLVYQNGMLSRYSVNIQGGDNIASYNISMGYRENEDIVKKAEYEAFDFMVNARIQMLKSLIIKPRVSLSKIDASQRSESFNATTNPGLAALYKSPLMGVYRRSEKGLTLPFYDEVSSFKMSNPVSLIDNALGNHENFRVRAGFSADQQIVKGLSLNVFAFTDLFSIKENSFVPQTGVVSQYDGMARNVMSSTQRNFYSILTEGALNYDRVFGFKHRVTAKAGVRSTINKFEEESSFDINSPSDQFVVVGKGDKSLRSLSPSNGDWNMLSFFGAAGYAYKDKYYLDVNLSVDGSSKFSASNRFGYFPVASAGWRVSSEPFMSEIGLVSDLKLRASYGILGNDDIGYYSSRFFYVGVPLFDITGLVRGGIPSTDLKWEERKQLNLGADLSFWNDRIAMTVDYYQIKSDDLVTIEQPNVYYGSDLLFSNSGSVENKGVELGVKVGVLRKKDVGLDLGFSISKNDNKLVSLGTNALYNETHGRHLVTDIEGGQVISKEGGTVNAFYGYETKGVITTAKQASDLNLRNELEEQFGAGDILFVDQNNDGVIDESDKVELGSALPDYYGSFSLEARYKRLRVNMLWDFVSGNEIYNNVRNGLESMDKYWNQSQAVMRRWRQDGQETDMPKAVFGDPMENGRFSDRWIEDGSFVRFKNVSVSYDFGVKNKIIRSLSAYVAANNLVTFTKYLGATPDLSYGQSIYSNGVDYGKVPLTRSVMMGVKLGI